MESLEFTAIIVCFAIVVGWYLKNAGKGANGHDGLLALVQYEDDTRKSSGRRYRMKPRLAHETLHERTVARSKTKMLHYPTFRRMDNAARMRRSFRRQDEARYRTKDKAAKYKPKNDNRPSITS